MIASDTYANRALDACYGDGRAAAWPASLRIMLFVGDPLAGGVEVSGGGYVRVTYANTTANWPAAAGRIKSNGTDVAFPVSTGAYSGIVTHWAVADSALVLCDTARLQDNLTVDAAGITPRIPAGALTISC